MNALDTDYNQIYFSIYLPQLYKATKIEVLCIVKTKYAMWNKDKYNSKIKVKNAFISDDLLRKHKKEEHIIFWNRKERNAFISTVIIILDQNTYISGRYHNLTEL